ncbi:MAG: succinate dehydrogenase, hydrophobic rane anchor protein [Pseudomonadota bacterium]|jgi:succinate dehydrogenase / fumarate reductase membrane anchor subunit
MSDLRTPLAKVRGLGSARDGTDHYIAQRLTAIALVPLLLWFVFSLAAVAGQDFQHVHAWVRSPFNSIALILLSIVLIYHAHIGLHEVVEDYLHEDVVKTIAMVLMKFLAITLIVTAIVAVLRIVLGG